MRAITIWQPWAWAIAQAGKNVENRHWRPHPRHLRIGDRLAIHAAARRPDPQVAAHLRVSCGFFVPVELVTSAVVAVCTYGGSISPHLGGLSQWHERGCWGWSLEDITPLPTPVPCRGAQGLWMLPETVEVAVCGQLWTAGVRRSAVTSEGATVTMTVGREEKFEA